jgi:hypothetical protein
VVSHHDGETWQIDQLAELGGDVTFDRGCKLALASQAKAHPETHTLKAVAIGERFQHFVEELQESFWGKHQTAHWEGDLSEVLSFSVFPRHLWKNLRTSNMDRTLLGGGAPTDSMERALSEH